MTQGTCTVHSWNDGVDEDEAEPRMGQRVDGELRPNRRLYEPDPHGLRQRPRRGLARAVNRNEDA